MWELDRRPNVASVITPLFVPGLTTTLAGAKGLGEVRHGTGCVERWLVATLVMVGLIL